MVFREKYWFLSNMYPCTCEYGGYVFNSSEALFQAIKCTNDSDIRLLVGVDGFTAKRIGRRVKLRNDWEKIKLDAMYDAVCTKFLQNKYLAELLMDTGNLELVEDNTWGDTFWGRCNGVGQNHLGKILMEIREELRSL